MRLFLFVHLQVAVVAFVSDTCSFCKQFYPDWQTAAVSGARLPPPPSAKRPFHIPLNTDGGFFPVASLGVPLSIPSSMLKGSSLKLVFNTIFHAERLEFEIGGILIISPSSADCGQGQTPFCRD